MILKWFAATTQKSCNKPEENEDAYGPDLENGAVVFCDDFSCVISDGATRSSFSGQFARALTKSFTNNEFTVRNFTQLMSSARKTWNDQLQTDQLPWHVQEKIKEGAFATLLQLQITSHNMPDQKGFVWKALAVGDSCLFQIRRNKVIKNLPVKVSSHFNNTPGLISTNLSSKYDFSDWIFSGEWLPGDEFVLATDAVAKWIYSQLEENSANLERLRSLLMSKQSSAEFTQWVNLLRKRKEIRDDDCTCIWIRVQ